MASETPQGTSTYHTVKLTVGNLAHIRLIAEAFCNYKNINRRTAQTLQWNAQNSLKQSVSIDTESVNISVNSAVIIHHYDKVCIQIIIYKAHTSVRFVSMSRLRWFIGPQSSAVRRNAVCTNKQLRPLTNYMPCSLCQMGPAPHDAHLSPYTSTRYKLSSS